MVTDKNLQEIALANLDYGLVDSESEPDLDQTFVRTKDFDSFTDPGIWLVLGPKGTGKSALFELFTRYSEVARGKSSRDLSDVIITAGTGFSDVSEVATGDIKALRDHEDRYEHEKLWNLYIAVRAALGVQGMRKVRRGPLKQLLRALGKRRDFRILPLLKALWLLTLGDAPSQVSLSAGGAVITLRNGRNPLDVQTLLSSVNEVLELNNKTMWVLFDKIDEIWPQDREERLRALEALLVVCMDIRRRFPRIQPRVFLRTDIWQEMSFTNKSHLLDKKLELQWSRSQLMAMMIKRACRDPQVRIFVESAAMLPEGFDAESLNDDQKESAMSVLFPPSAFPGKNEAKIVDWIEARVRDGRGTVLPRETIRLGNISASLQRDAGAEVNSASLVSREVVREAFQRLSRERCDSYLAEFPELQQIFKAFRGQTSARFSREDLAALLPVDRDSVADVLVRLWEIGLLEAVGGDPVTAREFEVPRLYRVGLGLVIRGRD